MKALIYAGKVVQLAEQSFPVHKGLMWQECPAEVTPGWNYANGVFTSPVDTSWTNPDAELQTLEASVTQRRLREAILTQEGKDWLLAHEAKITAARAKRGGIA